ncbi:pentatricopeptide repeat-containing protein, putative [Ricinus communis]|uniref:Pentatricopeptide repeat-containing protein, putative n=1 Tax=Ricinus communis TaxID=3988 RepID=B9RU43_RICCO|nr:pentatricopeptide repeat-containing protein, putative [Ricinus communis]
MSWRYKWSSLHIIRKTQILKSRSLRHFSSSSTQNNYFHSNQAFDHMVSVVVRLSNRYMTVRAIVRELESVGLVIKAHTFLLLLRIYWRGGMYSMVFETFEQMGRFGFEPNTFAHNVVMDVLFKIGQVDTGIKILKEMKSPNFLSYNIALTNLCKLNDLVKVKKALRIMLSKGYYPNVETFEMVLNCCCKLGRLVEACQLLAMMITVGISLSVSAWSILIDWLCRLNQPNMAFHLMERMVDSSCSPNVVTYTTLFKGFIESKMILRAFGILTAMQSKDGLIISGKCYKAVSLFRRAIEENYQLDAVSYTVAICGLVKSGRTA